MNTTTYVGLDIAKLTLDLSPHPVIPKRNYSNDPAGLRLLLAALRRLPAPVHIICEATGGYEHRLLQTLHQAQIQVTRLNPRQVRDFARAKGLLAKTDWLDAGVLAAYGQLVPPGAHAAC